MNKNNFLAENEKKKKTKAIWEEVWHHASKEKYFISTFYSILSCKGEMLYWWKNGNKR